MSTTTKQGDPGAADIGRPDPDPGRSVVAKRGWKHHFSLRNVGVIYVWAIIIVIFCFWAPNTFPQWATVQSILNQNAISGLVALALVVPLSARVFDLSVGNALGLCNVIVAWLLVEEKVPMGLAILLTVAAGLLIGIINGFIVIRGKIDSFIATLATGSLMAAATSMVSKNQAIIGPQITGNFGKISNTSVVGIQTPVFLMLVVAAVLWYLLNYTMTGRRIYATGFNEGAARLTGIKTRRLGFGALIVSGAVAGIGGVLLTSQVSSGSPEIGPPYLLSAFAAAFLGATQFGGRFNAWGTVVAVLLLGTGKAGLVLAGAPIWAPNMFTGVVLLVALLLTNFDKRIDIRGFIRARRNNANIDVAGA